jgi:hypothetical protein
MQPMIRQSKPAPAQRKITAVKVLAGVSFIVAALGFLSGSLTAATLACVTTTTLLIAEGMALRTRATQDQLEATSRELVALRLLLTKLDQNNLANHQKGGERDEPQNVVAHGAGLPVPQLSGD